MTHRIQKYRKKPVIIEAIRYNPPQNCEQVYHFVGIEWPGDHDEIMKDPNAPSHDEVGFFINTLEGVMEALPGDFIIKGVEGEFYPCKPDIFWKTYEMIDEYGVMD